MPESQHHNSNQTEEKEEEEEDEDEEKFHPNPPKSHTSTTTNTMIPSTTTTTTTTTNPLTIEIESETLHNMSHADLESLKIHLDALRERILALQNAQSTFLQLPAELRNHILRFAMYAELVERRDGGGGRCLTSSSTSTTKQTNAIFREPEFFATCRQIRRECLGVWFQDVLAWEEFVVVDDDDDKEDSASASLPSTLPNTSAPTPTPTLAIASVDVIAATSPPTPPSKYWKTLSFLDLQKTNLLPSPSFLSAQQQQQLKGERRKPSSSSLRLITQVIHCDLSRARAGVEGSTSIVPRKGLVRVQGWREGGPSLRWWVWY